MRRLTGQLRPLVESAALAVVYYWVGRLGVLTAIPPGVATAIWPASGVALAAVVLRGSAIAPGIWLGSLVLNFQILVAAGTVPPLAAFAAAAGIALGSSLQALLASWLIHRIVGTQHFLETARHALQFLGVAALSCLIAASLGVLSLCASGAGSCHILNEGWVTWWLGDLVGVLVMTPLLIVWSGNQFKTRWGMRRALEALVSLLFCFLVGELVFGVPLREGTHYAGAYAFFPVIMWAAFRLGPIGGVSALFVTAVLAVWGTVLGSSQFSSAILNTALLSVQIFVALAAVMSLVLGAVLFERKRTEEERAGHFEEEKRLRLELARSNSDLERFAQLASHDLREPVRSVILHLGLLESAAKGALSETAETNLRFAYDGAQRMQRLIEALLEFSRVRAQPRAFGQVACDEVVGEVLWSLKAAIAESETQVKAEPLPTVAGDPVQIGQLFQNLLANGIKYRARDHRTEIRVAAEKIGKEWLFRVSDNGIGFEMKYATQIFEIFERLHPASRIEGSGLGLSLCKSIVERHGGRIWAESEVGRGSTFFFTLPALG